MSLGPAPLSAPVLTGDTKQVAPAWRAWISQLFGVVQALGTNGTTGDTVIATWTSGTNTAAIDHYSVRMVGEVGFKDFISQLYSREPLITLSLICTSVTAFTRIDD